MTQGVTSSAWEPAPVAPAAASAQGGKIEELESLRGLAAFLVVFFHMPKWHPWLDIGPVNNGYLMVELFFVLSGYVIYNAYGDRLDDLRGLLRFQWLRFGRLYPVHLLFLAAFLGLEILRVIVSNTNQQPFAQNSVEALIQQIFLLQAIIPNGHSMTFNSPAWSISTEFYTYLLFAAILVCARRWRIAVFGVIATLALAALLMTQKDETHLLLNCLAGFFIGCLLCWGLQKRELSLPAMTTPLAMLLLGLYVSLKQPEVHDWAIFPLSALLIVALLKAREGLFTTLMRARPLVWLGALSYSIYMSHSLIITTIILALKYGIGLPEFITPKGTSAAVLPPWGAALAVLTSILVVLAVSHIVYRIVEVPLRKTSRDFARRHIAAG